MTQEYVRLLVTEENLYYKDVPIEELNNRNVLTIFNEESDSFILLDTSYDFNSTYLN